MNQELFLFVTDAAEFLVEYLHESLFRFGSHLRLSGSYAVGRLFLWEQASVEIAVAHFPDG